MTLWRVHLRPDADGIDPVDVCLRQQVIGVGWRVPMRPNNRDEYWSLGEKEYGDVGWSRAANAIGWRMAVGDLVWIRDFYGAYYLGEISGDWEYRDDPENIKADIINVRPCELFRVGTNVAGKIVNCFRPSATVQRIHDDTAELFSAFIYNQVTTGDNRRLLQPSNVDIFSLLTDVDLEDIVGLYLQHTKGLLFVPSSRSRQNTTIFSEYQLIDPKTGRPTYVQVKSGNVVLDPGAYYNCPDQFFLFSPAGYSRASTKQHVVCLDRTNIEAFLKSARGFLPLNVSIWLDMHDKLAEKQ